MIESISSSSGDLGGQEGDLFKDRSHASDGQQGLTRAAAVASASSFVDSSTGGASSSTSDDDPIVIHIYDENRGIQKDFSCSRSLLLNHMKYFKSYISDSSNKQLDNDTDSASHADAEDIDISVHCDVYIFEFLVEYMNNPSVPPKFETSSVVSILISSDFLQMEELVVMCLRYFAANLEEILLLPVDLSCVSDSMCARLAKLCPAEVLVGAVDKKGRLLPRLYKKRLEVDFRERPLRNPAQDSSSEGLVSVKKSLSSNSSCLVCCRYCDQLFPETEVAINGGYVRCQATSRAISVGFHGELVYQTCEPVDKWSLTNFVASLRRQQLEWREIYWLLWSAAHMLRLEDGGLVTADCDHTRACHAKQATFADIDGSAKMGLWGVYPCCGETALKLNPWDLEYRGGCSEKPLKLAPAVKVRSSPPTQLNYFYNDESRIRVAGKARKVFGSGYGTKFQQEIKVALEEMAQAAPGAWASRENNEKKNNWAGSGGGGGSSNNAGNGGSVGKGGGSSGNHWASLRSSVTGRRSSSSNNGTSSSSSKAVINSQQKAYSSQETSFDYICTTSVKAALDTSKHGLFINAPIIYLTNVARKEAMLSAAGARITGNSIVNGNSASSAASTSGSNYHSCVTPNRFVGATGFARFASARGAYINSPRYLSFAGLDGDGQDLLGENYSDDANASASDAQGTVGSSSSANTAGSVGKVVPTSSSNALLNSSCSKVTNEPLKGLSLPTFRSLSRSTSSRVALSMDVGKRNAWYRDSILQSDVDRIRSISSHLAALRTGFDLCEGERGGGSRAFFITILAANRQ